MINIPNEIWENVGAAAPKTFDEVERSVSNSLLHMQDQADRMIEEYERYCRCEDERLQDTILSAITSRLNHIVQAFCDVMIFIEINEPGRGTYEETLSYHIRQYEMRKIAENRDEEKAVEFFKNRNSIVHDYLNSARLNNDLLKAISSYGDGFRQLPRSLSDYCAAHFSAELLEKRIPDSKKTQ